MGILFLLVIIFTSIKLVQILSDVVAGQITKDIVFQFLYFKMIATLPKILPPAVLLAVLLVYSTMNANRELIILSTFGVLRDQLTYSVLKFVVALAMIVAMVAFYLAPYAERELHQLREEAKQYTSISALKNDQFNFLGNDLVLYVQQTDNTNAHNIFLQLSKKDRVEILSAEQAYFVFNDYGQRYVVFQDGLQYTMPDDNLAYHITEYEQYQLLIADENKPIRTSKIAAIPTYALLKSSNISHQAEWQWRVAMIIATILLPLVVVCLFATNLSHSRYLPIIIAIFIYLLYSNLLNVGETWIIRGVIPSSIGLWWIHLLLLAVIVFIHTKSQTVFMQKRL